MSALIIIALILLGVVLWAVCGVLAYGLTTAYFQQHFYEIRQPHRLLAGYLSLLGPIGLAISYFMGELGYHGLQWHCGTSDWVLYKKITPQVRADTEAVENHPRKVHAEVAPVCQS